MKDDSPQTTPSPNTERGHSCPRQTGLRVRDAFGPWRPLREGRNALAPYSEARILLTALFFLSAPLLHAGVEYPAAGNFDPEEGTVEMWVTPMADELYPPDDGKYYSVFSLFSTKVEGEWNIGCGWYRHGTQIGIKASMNSPKVPKGLTAVLPNSPPPKIEQGKMLHFALTWKGKEIAMFVDGQPAGGKTQAIGLPGSMEGATLVFGGDGKNDNRIILNAIRISSYAKDASRLHEAKPSPELETLLLENFDPAAATSPLAFTLDGELPKSTTKGKAHPVTTPTAGLALYPEVSK
jgi:hypothetical protein